MSVAYAVKDVWEYFIYKFGESLKEGVEISVKYDGIEAGVSFDVKALKKLAELFKKGVPLELAVGIDLPKILSSLEGEALEISIKTVDAEVNMVLKGEVLKEFRAAMESNPIDGETLEMMGKFLERLVE
jgi:hypothetical protein